MVLNITKNENLIFNKNLILKKNNICIDIHRQAMRLIFLHNNI